MERAPALHARSFSLDGDTVGPPNFNYAAHPAVPRPPEAADPAPVFANAHGLTNASAMAAPAAVEPAVPAPTVAAPADQLDRPEVCDRPPLPAPAKVRKVSRFLVETISLPPVADATVVAATSIEMPEAVDRAPRAPSAVPEPHPEVTQDVPATPVTLQPVNLSAADHVGVATPNLSVTVALSINISTSGGIYATSSCCQSPREKFSGQTRPTSRLTSPEATVTASSHVPLKLALGSTLSSQPSSQPPTPQDTSLMDLHQKLTSLSMANQQQAQQQSPDQTLLSPSSTKEFCVNEALPDQVDQGLVDRPRKVLPSTIDTLHDLDEELSKLHSQGGPLLKVKEVSQPVAAQNAPQPDAQPAEAPEVAPPSIQTESAHVPLVEAPAVEPEKKEAVSNPLPATGLAPPAPEASTDAGRCRKISRFQVSLVEEREASAASAPSSGSAPSAAPVSAPSPAPSSASSETSPTSTASAATADAFKDDPELRELLQRQEKERKELARRHQEELTAFYARHRNQRTPPHPQPPVAPLRRTPSPITRSGGSPEHTEIHGVPIACTSAASAVVATPGSSPGTPTRQTKTFNEDLFRLVDLSPKVPAQKNETSEKAPTLNQLRSAAGASGVSNGTPVVASNQHSLTQIAVMNSFKRKSKRRKSKSSFT